METISKNDTGDVFIGKLNSNFTESAGGGGGAIGLTRTIPMQGGMIASDGFPKSAITTDTEFLRYAHSVNYVELVGEVQSITASTGTLRYHCYNANYSYLGVSNDITQLENGTSLIRIEVTSTSNLSSLPIVTVEINGSIYFKKSSHSALTAKFFCFETSIPYLNVGNTGSYYGHNERHYDQGYIKLPPNYSPDGAPVQLVFYCHGSDGYQWGETSVLLYDSLLDFICNNGFAVVDCSGITSFWRNGDINPYINSTNCNKNCKWQPTAYSAYCNLYDYIIDNYNVCTDGVYVFGKSAGGMAAEMLSLNQPFPIRAAGGLAPALSMNGTDMRYGYVNGYVLKQWLLMWGASNHNDMTATGNLIQAGSADIARLLADAPLFVGYDPFTANTDIDFLDLTTKMYQVSIWNYGTTQAIKDIINASHKFQPCPYKIWQAQDDEVLPWAMVEYYKQLVEQGNGICEIRQMPNGTGGHHSVDTDANAPKVDYQTKYAGVVNIPVAYAELVDWFNRW